MIVYTEPEFVQHLKFETALKKNTLNKTILKNIK